MTQVSNFRHCKLMSLGSLVSILSYCYAAMRLYVTVHLSQVNALLGVARCDIIAHPKYG